ncbi:MAG: TrmH family RNA methyltransferase [Microgenomates group bacterium]|jgi:tRNA G18 (ribose-2'-O)-methylase SpoU|nr:hypothetical protein [Candidatus Woesebacteria bacterium]MBP6883322.1 hypothetical protein [Candidatus Woesebacteria bacterium]QQR64092.1 MAG: hypothetical protein IPH70_00975 [Candidatus Roizmanbacteria bacterium]
MKLNSKQLRDLKPEEAKLVLRQAQDAASEQDRDTVRNPIFFIVENVYDTYNVGGLFRLADALNVAKIYLCGETEIPPNHKIVKASIGTYKIVPWEYKSSAAEAIAELRTQNSDVGKNLKTDNRKPITIIAVEQSGKSIDYRKASYEAPVALLVGNETSGVTEETLTLCDQIVEIPMWGINKSLNVIVSAAIVGYFVVGSTVTPSES